MSNTLAIAAVTSALQQILGDVANPLPGDPDPDSALPGAFVTCKPLDIARAQDEKKNQLNLFLFQLQHHAGFRNMATPGMHEGESAQQPLSLVLYYVLTAYGANDDDLQAHRMIGRAMSILHDNSTMSRSVLQSLIGSDLWQQAERVRIRPHPLGTEEISKLWTGFSRPYRISIGYEVSVVLIDSTKPAIAPIPVLTRGKPVGGVEPGPRVSANLELPYPVLESFECDLKRPAVRLGEMLTIRGHNLGGTPLVARFNHRLFGDPEELLPTGPRTPTSFQVQIPATAAAWPPGTYTVDVDVTSDQVRTTNVLSVPLAPRITSVTKVTSTSSLLMLEVVCTPEVWADQKVSLIVGNQQVAADPHGQTDTLQFMLDNPPSGLTYVRLRVDGVDSLLVTDFTSTPPVYDPLQAIILP